MLVTLRSGFGNSPDAGILQGPIVVTLKTFSEGMKYVCVCLKVCLCVLAYVAVDLCGSVCGMSIESLYTFWVSEEATLILIHYWYRIVLRFPWVTLALDVCTGHV